MFYWQGLCMSAFACLSRLKESQRFLLSLIVQSLTTFLETPVQRPQAGSSPMNGRSDPSLSS
jgi:hypothetical protein